MQDKDMNFIRHQNRFLFLSRPILTHYSFEKLSNVLVLTNFDVNGLPTFSHGVSYKNGNIQLEKKGLFQRFHDCYSLIPQYTQKSAHSNWKI